MREYTCDACGRVWQVSIERYIDSGLMTAWYMTPIAGRTVFGDIRLCRDVSRSGCVHLIKSVIECIKNIIGKGKDPNHGK